MKTELTKVINWAKKESAVLAFNLVEFDEAIDVTFETRTKTEISDEVILIWEINDLDNHLEDIQPILIKLERLISVVLG